MPIRTEIFLNNFPSQDDRFWNQIAISLQRKGYTVNRQTVECDHAILLNAHFLNPSVFRNKTGFVLNMPEDKQSNSIYWMTHVMNPILERYFDDGKYINLYGLSVEQAVKKVTECYDSKHTERRSQD